MVLITPPPAVRNNHFEPNGVPLPEKSFSTMLEERLLEQFKASGQPLPPGGIHEAVRLYYDWCYRTGSTP